MLLRAKVAERADMESDALPAAPLSQAEVNRPEGLAPEDPCSKPQADSKGAMAGPKLNSAIIITALHKTAPWQWTWLTLLVFLAFWEIASRSQLISPVFFPAPSKVGQTAIDLGRTGELWSHLSATLIRMWGGLLLGSVPAICLGFLMGWSSWLRKVLDPLVALGNPIPKVAILPLIMVIFGIGDFSRMVVVALAVFFIFLINTMGSVTQIEQDYFELAAIYNARPSKVLTRVILPASLPMIISSFRIGVNVALIVTIAVEMVASQVGLGIMIWMSWEIMRIDELYAAITLVAILGLLFNHLANLLSRILIPWRTECDVE